MRKKITRLYYLFWVCLAGYLFLAFSSNPPNGRTGSPPTFSTCSGCHSSGAGTGTVAITGLPGTIDPSTTYPITVTVTATNALPEFGGFQMNVLDDNNSNFGTLSNPGPSSTVSSNFFEHNPALPFSTPTLTYTVDWTSPAAGNTNVTMYAAALLADGNGNTSGDATATTTAVGSFMGSAGPITVTGSSTDVSCFGGNDGTATATASGGGGGPYTYNWSNGMSGAMISNLTAGSYTVTATNANGGTPGETTVVVNQPATAVLATILNVTNIDCTNPVGSVTADGSGGTPGYTYNWSNGMTGATINVSNAGNYIVTVTDANLCTATTSANVSENTTVPTADAGPAMAITCSNSTVVLDGSASSSGGGIGYLWTTVDGNIVSGGSTTMPTVDAAGTYVLTVTNSTNGCTASASTTVAANNTPPVVTIAPAAELTCVVQQVTLDATGSSTGVDVSYLWTTANGNIVSGETTLMPVVDAAGTYTLTITNSTNGCTAAGTVEVVENTSPPIADAGPNMTLNCNNATVVLNGTNSSSGANITYLWETVDGNIVSGGSTTTPTVNAAGTYVLTVTNGTNGCSSVDQVEVNETPALVASISSTTNVDCNGNATGSATAVGTGGNGTYSYAWSNGGNTATINNLAAGNYTVTISDEDNCTATAVAMITEPVALMVTVSTVDESGAGSGDGSATANPTGGTGPFTFLWNINETTQTISNLSAGTYTVTVTDANGCTVTGSGTVNSFDCSAFSATGTSTDASCNGAADGTATANPSGGTMPYVYAWSNGQTTQTAIDLMAGMYMVTITEENGCSEVLTITVMEPSAIVVSTVNMENVSCAGALDGAATVDASGGDGSYTYAWSNGAIGSTLMNVAAGQYTVTATDMSGCTGELTISITEPPVLNLSGVSITGVFCHGDSTGAVTVSASGGTPNYTYDWSDGGMGQMRTGLPAGNYTVTATDVNGCTKSLQVIISEPAELFVNATSTDETNVNANDGTASSSPSGGVGGYSFLWSTGATSAMISGLAPGTYCVSVTDLNDCTIEECVTVNAFACAGVAVSTSGTMVSCFGGDDGTAMASGTGFEAPLEYIWSNDSTTAAIDGLMAGIYTVTITGANGCTGTDDYEVIEPMALSVEGTVVNAACEDSEDGSITASASGGTAGYTYEWSDGTTGPILENVGSGSYMVMVVDNNGCMTTESFMVGVDPDTVLPNVVLQNITVALDANGMAAITAGMVDNGSTDNCGIDSIVVDITSFSCEDLGDNEVVVAVQDLSGNCGFDMAIVTVVDTIPPSISCPDNVTVQSVNCEEIVDYDDPIFSDNCAGTTFELTSGGPPGSTFPSGTTTVEFEATDASGNTSTCSFNITINNGFSGMASGTDVTCNGSGDGSVTADPVGGSAPFTYLWDDPNNQMGQTATDLSAATYTVTITDSNGCTTTASATVIEPPVINITIDNVTSEILNAMDGAIDVTVAGGVGDYSYEWMLVGGGVVSNEEDLAGVEAGDYILTVIDANGCVLSSETITIDLVISTNDPLLNQYIEAYPNPVTDQMFITFNLPERSAVQLEVFDLNGQLVSPVIKDELNQQTVNIDASEWSAGIYIVRILVNDRILMKRMVVGQ